MKEKKEWIKVEILDHDLKPTGVYRVVRDLHFKAFQDNGINNLKYVEHCHFHNPNLQLQ
jgi:hypothetical protein